MSDEDRGWYPDDWLDPIDNPDLPEITEAPEVDNPDPVPPQERLDAEPDEVEAEDHGQTVAEELQESQDQGPPGLRTLVPSAVGINLRNYSQTPQQRGWGAACTARLARVALPGGAAVSVDSRLAELVLLIMKANERDGYRYRAVDTGAYNCRYIGGTTVWSWHAWGIAIDQNWQSNPYTATLRTDMPVWLRDRWNRYGFAWGGDYSGRKDAMHHEFMGTPQDAVRATELARRELAGIPIVGAIKAAYDRVGGAKTLGKPLGPEVPTADPKGRWQNFELGRIYYHPAIDRGTAHVVAGEIEKKFIAAGVENKCGWPITDELATPNGKGRYNHFSHPDGLSIYWSPQTGAHLVRGEIRKTWGKLGWEQQFLGFPTTDEKTTPDKKGRYTHFQGGSIYWFPGIGAVPVHGRIREAWAEQGWERGKLGYPIDIERAGEGGRVQAFQGGTILYAGGKATVRLLPEPTPAKPPVPKAVP
jgi:hypothetical protein